jgi:hypothetical protein
LGTKSGVLHFAAPAILGCYDANKIYVKNWIKKTARIEISQLFAKKQGGGGQNFSTLAVISVYR